MFYLQTSAQTPDSLGIYTIATSFPSYRGGDDSLYHFIYDHIAYPKDALTQRKQGKLQLRIVIDESGNVPAATVMRGVSPSIDSEAVRVIKATSGQWESGHLNGKPVKMYKYLPVTFKIDTTQPPVNTHKDTSLAGRQLISIIVNTAYKTDPLFRAAYDNFQIYNYTLALPDLNQCIREDKSKAAALFIRASIYVNERNYEAACPDISALRFDPKVDMGSEEWYYKYCTGVGRNVPTRHRR